MDLDFFWDSDGNKLYDDSYIRKFALCLNNSMNNIKVLTIALSPDCIPGSHLKEKWNNVIHVLDILKIDLRCLSESDLNIK